MPDLITLPVKSPKSRRRCKNTNKGSSYWVSPEGEKFTLNWSADEAGFQPKGDHLPVAPVHEYELPVAPVHEYELPVHVPFNGKGYKIY